MKAVQIIICAGFLVGTITHIVDLITQGEHVYAGAPAALRWFFVALVVLDPIVAVLVLARPRVGVTMAVAVMIVDVPANWYLTLGAVDGQIAAAIVQPMLVLQTLFGLFVVATAVPLWRRTGVGVR